MLIVNYSFAPSAGRGKRRLPTVAPADSRALTRPPIGALLLTLAQPVLCHFVADNRGPALNPPRFICRRQRFGGFLESSSLYLPLAALRRFPLPKHPIGRTSPLACYVPCTFPQFLHYVNPQRQKKKTGSPRRSFLLHMSSDDSPGRLPRCPPSGACCVVVTNCGPMADPPHRNAFPSAGSEWRTGGADPLSLHRRRSPLYRPRFRKRGRHAQ